MYGPSTEQLTYSTYSALPRDTTQLESALSRDITQLDSTLSRDITQLDSALSRDINQHDSAQKSDPAVGQLLLAVVLAGSPCVGRQLKPGNASSDRGN